jgi:hypothetical protein
MPGATSASQDDREASIPAYRDLEGRAAIVTGQTIYVDGGLTAQLTPPGIWI